MIGVAFKYAFAAIVVFFRIIGFLLGLILFIYTVATWFGFDWVEWYKETQT